MDSIDEFFRLDQFSERERRPLFSFSKFSKSLITLSSSIVFYIIATAIFDIALENFMLYHLLTNWDISFFLFVTSKSALGICYVLVGNYYVKLTKTINLSRAGLTSFLFTIWGLMHLYDSIVLFLIWPKPEDLLKMLENTSDLTIYLNVFLSLTIVLAIIFMGLNFYKLGSKGLISKKLRIPGLLLGIGAVIYLLISLFNLINIQGLISYADILFYVGEITLSAGYFIAGVIFLKNVKE